MSERVSQHEAAAQGHGQGRPDRIEPARARQGDAEDVVRKGPEQVLANHANRCSGEGDGGSHVRGVVAEQADAGLSASEVNSATERDAGIVAPGQLETGVSLNLLYRMER